MAAVPEHGFTLGCCSVIPEEHAISREGQLHHVEPKTMSVLMALASSPGRTITRDDLISTVWPRGFVTDDVLSRCISHLRSALGDDPKSPSYIATVPRKGYRLVAEVEMANEASQGGLLVLPFQNLAAHGKDEYLADGLTELLIARLAVGLDERVISRTTAMAYRGTDPGIGEIREKLGVDWVVEGSLLQLGATLQIVVQLIDAKTDAHAWAETWTRPAGDITTVLNEVTRHVSTQINARISRAQPATDKSPALPDELMRRYLQGMHHVSRRVEPSLRQAIICFDEVLDERPDHAPALAGMAMCYMLLVHYNAETAETGIPKVRALSQKALEIDPRNADAMGHLAAVSFFHDWDFERAGELAETALSIKPNHEMIMMIAANVHLICGRYEQSQALVDKAVASDPLNVGLLMNAGDILILQRRYGEAIRCLSQALELAPGMRPSRLRLALAYSLDGNHEGALRMLEFAEKGGGQDAAWLEYDALVNGLAGDSGRAQESASKLEALLDTGERVQPWSLARAWASCGESDKAIAYLEKACELHSSSMPFLGLTPALQSIQNRPEVRGLMEKVGLPV